MSPLVAAGAFWLAVLSACATVPAAGQEAQRSRELQQLAQSVMTDSGNVSVKLDGDTCFVFGFVQSAIDEQSILRALRSADGVREVRNGLQREM